MELQKEFERRGNWLFQHRSWLTGTGLIPAMLLFWRQQSLTTAGVPSWLEYYETGCLVVGLLGLMIRAIAVGYSHTNTSGRNTRAGQIADSLNTKGIYSIVRHPLYLGNFLMWLSVAMLIGNVWFIIVFILLFWLYYERIMFAEEQFLEKKFGEQFADWADSTPAFLPRSGQFVRPDCSFNWKKALRAEKNGLLALFLVFTAFDIAGAIIRDDHRYNDYLIAGCIGVTILYLTLKCLKYRNNVFIKNR